jgi:hypothetical protein
MELRNFVIIVNQKTLGTLIENRRLIENQNPPVSDIYTEAVVVASKALLWTLREERCLRQI